MPWHQEPMKDVAGDETPRGAASKRRSGDVRMGKPGQGNAWSLETESIGLGEVSPRTETSQ